jgi:hypothetical protein
MATSKAKTTTSKAAPPEEEGEKIDKRRNTEYRDEMGVRKQTYRRFKEGRDYEGIEAQETAAMLELMRIGIFGEEIETETGERVRVARPRKYNTVQELQEGINNYIKFIQDKAVEGVKLVPDVEGLCCYLGISRSTLFEWQRTRSAEFSNTINTTLNAIASYKKQLAINGKIPPIVFATDFNNNHGYVQQHNIDINSNAKRLDAELPSKEDIIKRLPPATDTTDYAIDVDVDI